MSWFNIFKRGSKIMESKANAALDNYENAVEMSNQVIRDLKNDLDKAINAQATFKSMISKLKSEKKKFENKAIEWEKDANELQDRIDSDPTKSEEYETLIIAALENVEKCTKSAELMTPTIVMNETKYNAMVEKIKNLNTLITEAENDLTLLKARQEVANASISINKELCNTNGIDNAKDVLKRMEQKVSAKEHLADAYAGVDEDNKTTEQKIADVLKNTSPTSASEKLAAFKAKREKKVNNE